MILESSAASAQPIDLAIVDDDESVRVSLRRLCIVLGLSATAYPSGEEFLRWLDGSERQPDCLLLDAHMPHMTGLEVQQHLVRAGVRFPTIIYTADDAPEVLARHVDAGVAGYLEKPIDGDKLLATITQAIAMMRYAAPRVR
jgi:FixJ family two-component response regulator